MYLFNRANGRSIVEKPAADRMPEGFLHSVAAQNQVWERLVGQKRGSSPKGAGAFRFTFVRTKVNPSETKQRRGPLLAPSENPGARGQGELAEGQERAAWAAKPPKATFRSGWLRKKSPAGAAGKNKTAPLPHKETKGAKDLCGTTLLAPETGATQACDVTVTPGGAYWGYGGKPAGLVGAAAPRGSSRRAASSALPPNGRLSVGATRGTRPYPRSYPE